MVKAIFLRFMVAATSLEVTLAEVGGNPARLSQARADYRKLVDKLDAHLIARFLEGLQ